MLVDERTESIYAAEHLAKRGIAVLAPHRAQNSSIRQHLREHGFGATSQPMPIVDTVDKLQGQERDVVFVSYGVADGEYAEGEAEFLLSANRFNVAATRARHKLIVFYSDAVLDVVPTDRQVLLNAMMLKEFRRYCNTGSIDVPWQTPAGENILLHIQWKGLES